VPPLTVYLRWLACCIVLLCIAPGKAQHDSDLVFTFDFNDHTLNEAHNQLPPAKGVGTTMAQDRFGNEQSAVHTNGTLNSYLNLGTSPLLKSPVTTISLWINVTRKIYSGTGSENNPILITKNGPQDDFNLAYAIVFDWSDEKLGVSTTKDSLNEAIVVNESRIEWGRWYHLVLVSSNSQLCFYVDGELRGCSKKDFETAFLVSDSVVIGNTANKKNSRYTMGTFDDIRIYHRVLNAQEIMELYRESDPNKTRLMIFAALKWLGLAALVVILSFLLLWRRRQALKRAQEKLDINRRLHEMETRTLKAQMNPHFIFNSLNSIKQFVMLHENEKAELYLTKFAKLIRELLESNMNESLSVKEEAEILNGYLDMESLRFDAMFSFTVLVDEAIDASRHIPHLMIQPFVENAIWHGLLTKTGDRTVWIRLEHHTERTMRCIVEDNGVGRKKRQNREETFKKRSLALSLVNQRLELMQKNLGVECSVTVLDMEDSAGESLGTKVIIILPYIDN